MENETALATRGNGAALVPWQEMNEMADAMAKSKMFAGWDSKEKILTLMLICRDEGRNPASAVMRYENVQGRIAKKSTAMLEDFISYGGTVQWKEITDRKAAATFVTPEGQKLDAEYSWEDVVRAGNQNKDNYKKYPKDMMRARLVSQALRSIYPKACGLFYAPEEVADFVPLDTKTPAPAQLFAPPPIDIPVIPPIPPQENVVPTVEKDIDSKLAELPQDKLLAFLIETKWIPSDAKDISGLTETRKKQIAQKFESFAAKVNALEKSNG